MHLTLFGPPTLIQADQPVALDTRKALALAGYLAATGKPHSRDHLAALFWPESDNSRAKGALRRTLSTLKRGLGGQGLETDGERIALRPSAGLTVDLWTFEAALAECDSHAHPADQPCPHCLDPLRRAVECYTADFLAGFGLKDSVEFDDWQYFQAESLRRTFVGALDRLVTLESRHHRWEAAIAHAHRRLIVDSLHEPAHRQLMRLYALSGQRAAALRQYQECVRILDVELGVLPLDETKELHMAIQANKISPAPSPGLGLDPAPTTGPQSVARDRLPLVGRGQVCQQLVDTWGRSGRTGRLIALMGEAGIGKSRLLEELLAQAQAQGGICALTRCFPGESGLAFGTLMEALRPLLTKPEHQAQLATLPTWQQAEVGRLFPELRRDTGDLPPALDSPGGQARFFQALADLLATLFSGPVMGVLAFDDLQWVDGATLDFLAWCARRLAGLPLCLALAWRTGENGQDHALFQLAQSPQHPEDGVVITLDRLSRADVAALSQAVPAAQALGDAFVRRLHEETEGLPFLLVDQLAALAEGRQEQAEGSRLPRTVRDLFSSRLNSLDGVTTQVIAAAAVIGRSFDLETVQSAAGRSEEEIVEAVEQLLQRRLVVEQVGETEIGLPRYDFCHEKLRELVYAEIALVRRRLLHRRVAEGLARRIGRTPGSAALAAHHHRWAGQEAEAARLFALAGDEARQLYANAEALAHYAMALALGHPDRKGLHRAQGELLTLQGNYSEALAAFEQAQKEASPFEAAEIQVHLGGLFQRQGEWDLAEQHYRSGLAALMPGSHPATQARLFSALSQTLHLRGEDGEARHLAEKAQAAADQAKDAHAQAEVANLLGLLARHQGDLVTGIGYLQSSLAAAKTLADPGAEIAALNNLALALADAGDFATAQTHLDVALGLCLRWGDRHRAAALHNNLADLLHRAGDEDAAMIHLKQAVLLFAEIGEPGGPPTQAGIWKLAEW